MEFDSSQFFHDTDDSIYRSVAYGSAMAHAGYAEQGK